jgi:hypothetical protein
MVVPRLWPASTPPPGLRCRFIYFEDLKSMADPSAYYWPEATRDRSSVTLAVSAAFFSAFVGTAAIPYVSPETIALLKYKVSPYFSKMILD